MPSARYSVGLAVLCLALIWGLAPRASTPAMQTSAICDAAGQRAAAATGVPELVLRAIALTETGRRLEGKFRPWPWTVNMEGAGKWFDTPTEAMAFVRAHHDKGARSYDVGCFQINYRWHGNAFSSLEDMFDPLRNATYAANFLKRLHAETGSWAKSAAAYHSRTPKYAKRYQQRFEKILARLGGPPPTGADSAYDLALSNPGGGTLDGAVSGIGAPIPGLPVAVEGPLTITTPAVGQLGSLAPVNAMPRGRSLLTGARPLF